MGAKMGVSRAQGKSSGHHIDSAGEASSSWANNEAGGGSRPGTAPGSASRARSELELDPSAGGLARGSHWTGQTLRGHPLGTTIPGAASATPRGDAGLAHTQAVVAVSDRASTGGALGPATGPAGFGETAPATASLVAILNDARRSLVSHTGGFSIAQGRMVLTALESAGPSFLPCSLQLHAMRNCTEGCGDARAFDSLLASSVRILQSGSGKVANAIDIAARVVQGALEAHACSGICTSRSRQDPSPVATPTSIVSPANDETSTLLPPRSVSRSPSPPHKRFRGYPTSRYHRASTTAAVGVVLSGAASRARSRRGHARLQLPPPPIGPRFPSPSSAARRVELFGDDLASLVDDSSVSSFIVDGMVLWMLHRDGSEERFGGLRALTSADAADVTAAVGRDQRQIDRACRVLRDRLVCSAGTLLVPVLSGQLWWGMVIRGLERIVQLVVVAGRDGSDCVGRPVPDAALVVVDTSSIGSGPGGWDVRIIDGLFLSRATTICASFLRQHDNPEMLARVERDLRGLLPIDVVATRSGVTSESANNRQPALLRRPL